MQEPERTSKATEKPKKQGRGGRPKLPDGAARHLTIGVRVSPSEHAALQAKAAEMGMTPAFWLREAALSRRLPSAPVPAINRDEYAGLARMAGNLNQLARASNEGRPVTVDAGFLGQLIDEVARLRLALIGVDES